MERAYEADWTYTGNEIATRIQNSTVQGMIANALAGAYDRLTFVVVEHYTDRPAPAGKEGQGIWMYSEKKHEENVRQLRAAIEGVIQAVCSKVNAERSKQISFNVMSTENADATLYYLMHANYLVTSDENFVRGFSSLGQELVRRDNPQATIVLDRHNA